MLEPASPSVEVALRFDGARSGRRPVNRPVKSDRATAIDPVSSLSRFAVRRRRQRGRAGAEPAQVFQDHVQPVPLDVLHRVVVHAAVLADPVDRHDPGVVQPRRRARLELESLHLHRVDPAVQRQDLQGDPPPQRLLHRLVDHAHAAPADLAEDAILAEPLESGSDGGRARERRGLVARSWLEPLHELECREELEDLLGPLGILLGVFGRRRILAAPAAVEKLGGQPLERVTIRGGRRGVHGSSLQKRPGGMQTRPGTH